MAFEIGYVKSMFRYFALPLRHVSVLLISCIDLRLSYEDRLLPKASTQESKDAP